MTLFVCVDDRMGMAFNMRRQSRDGAVCLDIAEIASGGGIGMDKRSATLFDGIGANIITHKKAAAAEFYFLEFSAPSVTAAEAERIILYRWNRRYPANLYFDIPLEKFIKTETSEFRGTSHEKITREVYIREK